MRRRLATLLAVGALLGSMLIATGVVFAANQAADLDQCANGQAPSPPTDGCDGSAGTQWVNGNLGESKSIYREGDSIAYRLKLTNLVTGGTQHTVTIEWDTTKAGKHAIDYLTTWNRTVANSNPCLGVANCVLGTKSEFAIPKDPQVDPGVPAGTGAVGGQPAGVFTIWGGTITGASAYSYSNGTGFAGDKSASIVLTFTASRANPVIAWGGHIATRQAWGNNNSAVAISGSPYHTRLLDLDGSGGNQDRSLSAAAVIFPARITVVKHVDTPSTTSFSFTGTDFTPSPFGLVDNSAATDPSKVSNEILVFGAHSVAEANPLPGYKLGSIVCTSDMTNNYTPTIAAGGAGGSVSITLEEGENVTCTFNNLAQNAVLTIDKTVSSVKNPDGTTDGDGKGDQVGDVISYSVLVTNTGNVTLTGVSVSDPLINGNLDCSAAAGQQTTGLTINVGGSITCTGTYAITQADLDGAGNAGSDADIDNTATADSDQTGPSTDTEVVLLLPAGTLTIDKTVSSVKNPDGTTDGDGKGDQVGDVISYSVLVTNTGNVTLTGVSVSDPLINGNLDCSAAAGQQTTGLTINVGGSITCTGTYAITQADLDGAGNAGSDADIDNTATADSDQTGPSTDTEVVLLLPAGTLTIDKTVSSVKNPDGTTDGDGKGDQVGDVISYSVLVTNTGNVTLTGVSVSDPLINGNLDCSAAAGQQTTGLTINVGGSITCTGTYAITQADLDGAGNAGSDADIDNTATADSDQTGPSTDTEVVLLLPDPGYSIDKLDNYADGEKFENVGDVITYTITVTNTGNTTLVGLVVTDVNAPNIDCSADAGQQTTVTIPVGGNVICSASHVITQADLDAGHFLNTACVDDGAGGEAEACDPEDTPGKNQPTISTADVLIPQDAITIGGLTAGATGTLYVELRINETCGQDAPPAYSKSWTGAEFTGNGTYNTANTVAVSTDATIRWCSSYSGDANNAARPLSARNEIVSVDFDPVGVLGFGAGLIPLVVWALWSRRRREDAVQD